MQQAQHQIADLNQKLKLLLMILMRSKGAMHIVMAIFH